MQTAISQRALIGRINRKLAKEGEALRTTRGHFARQSLGDFHIIDLACNTVTACRLDVDDLAELGAELKVIAPHESIASAST